VIEFHIWHKNAIFANESLGRAFFVFSELKSGTNDIWLNLENTYGKLHIIFSNGTTEVQNDVNKSQPESIDYGTEYEYEFSLSPPPHYFSIDLINDDQSYPQYNYTEHYQGYHHTQKYQSHLSETQKSPRSSKHTIIVNTNIPESIPQTIPHDVTIFQNPTRFMLYQNTWSIGDINVFDAYGTHIFIFRNQVLKIGTKVDIQDARTGGYIGSISQQKRQGMNHYHIYLGITLFALMKMKFSQVTPKCKLELTNGQIIEAEGDWKEYDFRFTRNGAIIAVASKAFFTSDDFYGLEINPGEDVALIIAATVILDKNFHENK